MALFVIPSDLRVEGRIIPNSLSTPIDSIGDEHWNVGSPLTLENQQHLHKGLYADRYATSVAVGREVVHVARAAGTLVEFKCGARQTAVGDSTGTFDLLKNGTTALSGTVVINAAAGVVVQSAGIAGGGTYVAGDVFEVSVTISAGTGTLPRGVFGQGLFREGY